MYKPERHAYPRQHGDTPTHPICQMLTEEQIENEIKKKLANATTTADWGYKG